MKANCPENLQGGGNTNSNQSGGQSGGGGRPLMWWKTPPANGQNETMEKHGKTHKWCNVCKRWTFGQKLHATSEHVVNSNTQTGSGQVGSQRDTHGPSNGQNSGSGDNSGAGAGTGNMAQPRAQFGGLVQCGNLFKSSGVFNRRLEPIITANNKVECHLVNPEFPEFFNGDEGPVLDDKGPEKSEETASFSDQDDVFSGGDDVLSDVGDLKVESTPKKSVSSLKECSSRIYLHQTTPETLS